MRISDWSSDVCSSDLIDTGCGMSAAVIERVFDPFYTTKPAGKGTGLGMSQVFAFCRQSGGEVQIQSTEGEGTRVAMLLPVAKPATGLAEADSGNAAAMTAAPGTALNNLVVEDDERVLARPEARPGRTEGVRSCGVLE